MATSFSARDGLERLGDEAAGAYLVFLGGPTSLLMVSIFASKVCAPSSFSRSVKTGMLTASMAPSAHGFKNFAGVLFHLGGGDDDGAGRSRHDLAGGFHAVELGHEEVHQDQVGPVAFTSRYGISAVVRDPHHLVRPRAQ